MGGEYVYINSILARKINEHHKFLLDFLAGNINYTIKMIDKKFDYNYFLESGIINFNSIKKYEKLSEEIEFKKKILDEKFFSEYFNFINEINNINNNIEKLKKQLFSIENNA
jgi:hypothetical protein